MGETGIFTSSSNQMLSSISGLVNILQFIVIIIGVITLITSIANTLRGQQLDLAEIIKSLIISGIMIGLGVTAPDMILKMLNQNNQSTVAEQKVEKENELSGEEKLKKLNDYRKSNHKDILLADKTETEHYINYLKKNDLYKKVLK